MAILSITIPDSEVSRVADAFSKAFGVPATVDVFAILPIPTSNLIPSFSATTAYAPANFNMQDIYIDADQANDGVLAVTIQ